MTSCPSQPFQCPVATISDTVSIASNPTTRYNVNIHTMTSAKDAVYVKQLDDFFRLGTYCHAKLPNQDPGTTTICRLVNSSLSSNSKRVLLFLPLFPRKKLACHPDLPSHEYEHIEHSIGSENVELYQTDIHVDLTAADNSEIIEILYPAFVFHHSELQKPENSWASGVKNVFVTRFCYFTSIHGEKTFALASPRELLAFPTDHQLKRDFPQLAIASRCYHKNVWWGLFQLRKALIKLLNRRSGQAESQSVQSLSIGSMSNKVINYIYSLANSNVQSLSCHFFPGSETYLDIDSNLTRRKIQMTFGKGMIRFETNQDLDMLRQFIGLPSVCGSTELRPTLKDGKTGKELRRGHCLTVIKGCPNEDRPPQVSANNSGSESRPHLHSSSDSRYRGMSDI